MIDINTKNEENEDELPLPSKKKTKKINPPESKDNLLSKDPRLKKLKRKSDTKIQNELIYNKNKMAEEDEGANPQHKKIQIEFMKPNGSSIYQTLLEFHKIYTVLYFIIEELLYVYKCHFFDFPPRAAGFEITSLIFYLFVQFGRMHYGSFGNRSEASTFVLLSIIFSLGGVYTYVHFFCLQTYVLRLELITNGVGMALWLFETVFGLLAFIGISGKESGI